MGLSIFLAIWFYERQPKELHCGNVSFFPAFSCEGLPCTVHVSPMHSALLQGDSEFLNERSNGNDPLIDLGLHA